VTDDLGRPNLTCSCVTCGGTSQSHVRPMR
jgi:hypothetical protein